MYIKKILLNNYRNYKDLELDLEKSVNIIYGDNSSGKTNILESINMCSYGKGFNGIKDSEVVNFKEDSYLIKISFFKDNRDQEIHIYYDKNTNKKYLYLNKILQKKVSSLIGIINIVIYKPDDIKLIDGSPLYRRNYFDKNISSIKPLYYGLITEYNNLLKQRNAFLKDNKEEFFKTNKIDYVFLEVLDKKLSEISIKISNIREEYINKISEKINFFHEKILSNNKKEIIEIKYIPSIKNYKDMLKELNKNIKNDFFKGYTNVGIHRDNYIVNINNLDSELYASQGQKKSILLSLKMTELNIIKDKTGESPVLLIDDFMSEIDEKRQKLFLENIEENQIIITCTDNIEFFGKNKRVFEIEDGKLKH